MLVKPVATAAVRTCPRHDIALAFATSFCEKFLRIPNVPKANTIFDAIWAQKIRTSPAKEALRNRGNKK